MVYLSSPSSLSLSLPPLSIFLNLDEEEEEEEETLTGKLIATNSLDFLSL